MKPNSLLSPIFVKADLEFSVDQFTLEFTNRNISAYGAYALPWEPLNARKHFGRNVKLKIRIQQPIQTEIQCDATILWEQSVYGELMGLKFLMSDDSRRALSQTIREHGFYPTEYIRKYPRIPFSDKIPTFPMTVLGSPVEADPKSPKSPIVFSIRNLSLNGILLSTENPFALSIRPGHNLDMTIEPRGDFMVRIRVQGMVCRVLDESASGNGNLVRHFGVKFVRVDQENRTAFAELLKDILHRIKEELESEGL